MIVFIVNISNYLVLITCRDYLFKPILCLKKQSEDKLLLQIITAVLV